MKTFNPLNRLRILLVFLSLILLAVIAVNIQTQGQIYLLDNQISQLIPYIQSPFLTTFFHQITNIFQPTILIILGLFLAYLVYKRHGIKKSKVIILSFILALILKFGLNFLLSRARPDNSLIYSSGFSFPSGHATFACLFFIILIFSLKHHISKISKISLSIAAVLMTLLIGFTRIYLNVHYFSDVLAGFLLAIFIFFLSCLIIEKK
ncbi:MAG: phosphatase PAP2 family protein [Nanoarchaeota archaeon]